jgi:hypothetical protein
LRPTFALGGTPGEGKGLLNRFKRSFLSLRVAIHVDVWSKRQGDAPISHREWRIEFGGAIERPDGFVVVECIDEGQPLVEKPLRLSVRRRHGMVNVAQPRDQ